MSIKTSLYWSYWPLY